MKKLFSMAAMSAATIVALTGCSDDKDFAQVSGEGNVILSATYNSDVKIASRADLAEELGETTTIWISSTKGLVRKFEGINSLPAEGIKLVAGEYVAEAWAGDSVSASFESRYFKGRQPFTITNGTERVELQCKIANVVTTVSYDDQAKGSLSDYTMTVGHKRGSLDFVGDDDRRGYFMMPTGVTDLTWTLTGKQVDGSTFTKSGVIENVQGATQYNLRVVFNPENVEIGGGWFDIVVDENAVDVEDQITITTPPQIQGYGFDIAKPVFAEPGLVGKRSVIVVGATELTNFVVASDLLTPIIGGNDVDLLTASDAVMSQLAAAEITLQKFPDENGVLDNLKLTFGKNFTANLENENLFLLTATDRNGKSSSATLNITVTEASVAADELAADAITTTATSARIYGTILKEDVTNPGFDYRTAGASDWTHVDGIVISRAGTAFYADLTGLTPGASYEYRATCDGFTSTMVQKLTTEAATQLPNSSFEEWSTSGSVVIPGTSLATSFWDSGNHGSATMNKNITNSSTDYAHSGSYSAKLTSQFVGMMGIGKFAAGNIFAGNYLYTDGTDGELGWGRAFTGRPKQLSVWVKYTPGTVVSGNNKGSGSHLSVGDMDKGVIYLALMDDNTIDYNTAKSNYNGTKWPVVVKTKSSNQQLFDPNSSHVIGYVEIALDSATAGDGLVNLKGDIHYYRTDVRPSYVVFVASASRFGDYFEGGEGSTMYLDDVELIY